MLNKTLIIIILSIAVVVAIATIYLIQKPIGGPSVETEIEAPAISPEEPTVTNPEAPVVSPKKPPVKPNPLPLPSLKEPALEITARPTKGSNRNSPISLGFGISLALAQELKTGNELQAEVRVTPPTEVTSTQTWVAGYTIKNTTDSPFVLTYDLQPSDYKTSGAVVVDPDGNGPEKYFYYTFGEEVLLASKSEQYFDISLSPPKGLTEITPRIVFKGFSTQEPFFIHEFTVKVIYIPPPAECETPICPEGQVLYWGGGVDDYKCAMLQCISSGEKCLMTTPYGTCAVFPQACKDVLRPEGWTIVDKCPPGTAEDCAIISPKGVCAESTSSQCTWNLPPEGWTKVSQCPK